MPRDAPDRLPTVTRSARHWVAAVSAGLALAWAGGFAVYLSKVPTEAADPALRTDAIVVLTGPERARLTRGVDLLAAGAAPRLLVSGVAPWTTEGSFFRWARRPEADLADAVTLGRGAADTVGNAVETADWMRKHHLRSLRLVTADYHMPRALWLMRLAMPDATILPDAVTYPFERPNAGPWYRSRGLLQRLAEYNKDMAQHVFYWLGLLGEMRLHEDHE